MNIHTEREIPRKAGTITVEIVVPHGAGPSGLSVFHNLDSPLPGRAEIRTGRELLTLLNEGTRNVSADPVRVIPGDKLRWRGETQEFSLRFSEGPPFQGGQASLVSDRGETKPLVVKRLNPGGPARYCYAITIVIGRRVMTLDPEVIVEGGC
jgi:hypothetical protein